MKESICTIPVDEIFEKKDGCPICRMRAELEERALDFVMGAAMMEPNVRHDTNRLGFCPEHLRLMCGRGNRLPLALMLDSHLVEISRTVFERHEKNLLRGISSQAAESAEDAKKITETCYVCHHIEKMMNAEFDTLWKMWKKDSEFRTKFKDQPYICLPDYADIIERASHALDKKSFAEFYTVVREIAVRGISKLQQNMDGFCKMYDYHNNGSDFGSLRNAVKDTVSYLSGRIIK